MSQFNGISGVDGEYLLGEMTAEEIAGVALKEPIDEAHLKELIHRHQSKDLVHLGVKEGIDPKEISETGWAIVFAFADQDKVDELKEALKPLLDLRKEQAGDFYQEFIGPKAYRPGESAREFLARHGASPAEPSDPKIVPYYLLIVASPKSLPYRVQYQLDVAYAVGRVHFDSLEEYANYAKSVAAAENGDSQRSKSATFFGVRNVADRATQLSEKELVKPLAEWAEEDQPDWTITSKTRNDAKKADLASIFNDDNGPALLFTASHGLGFPLDHPRQAAHQGALLCQDWPGPGNAPKADHYFSGADLGDDARLAGLIAFHFACYGAGTPQHDDFARKAKVKIEIATEPFVARLPQRLLGHPKGGALAAVGHVERAWGCSFLAPGAGTQIETFKSTLKRLMEGHPIGSAMEWFADRNAALATELRSATEEADFGNRDDNLLSFLWTANNDARSYVIVGDPAVKLAIA